MKLLKKFDDNILKILLTIFVFFIPLYPKFPFQVVNYTYIAIRIDDFLIAIIVSLFTLQILRGKIRWKELPFKKLFLSFWVIVFLSYFSGLYLTKTIEIPFVGLLHSARRVEYMILFYIAFASIKTVKDFKFLLFSLLSSLFLINSYAIGQRFFDFPAVSTMNPEFAKGRVLFLTPEARISSTFAGHYDLAAFLVFMFPILWGIFFYAQRLKTSGKEKLFIFFAGILPLVFAIYSLSSSILNQTFIVNLVSGFSVHFNQILLGSMTVVLAMYLAIYYKLERVIIFFLSVLSILILVFTASRTSSIAYLISTSAFLLLFKKFRYFLFILVLTLGLTYVDSDLLQRWSETFQIRQFIVNQKTGEEVAVQNITSDKLPAGTAFVKINKRDNTTASDLLKQDLINKATLSGKLKTASMGGITTEEDYETVTGFAADISLTTRFDASWPRAIKAFLRNPILGSGPSSITEASDGDYFRWIGEIGLAGTLLFIGLILTILKKILEAHNKVSNEARYLIFGVIFGTFGLFINALLIDVFEASKVAYMFWFTMGIFTGLVMLDKKELKKL